MSEQSIFTRGDETMLWHFDNSEPLTNERFRAVHTDDGRAGWVSIRHEGGRPAPFGGVWDQPDGETWSDGSPVERKCLDVCPTFAESANA